MTEFQKRVVVEKEELDLKLERLKLFFNTEIFDKLKSDEKERLSRQLIAMNAYSDILGERISNF